MSDSFVIKGAFYFCTADRNLVVCENAYCLVRSGVCEGLFDSLPEEGRDLEVLDYSPYMILPGFVDLHLHAPQYSFRALGLDLELLKWLSDYTFPGEHKYKDTAYAERMYTAFTDDLRRSFTTRACVFGTIYTDTTLLLAERLEDSGLCCYVGKVNMDRNAPDYYIEDTAASIAETRRFIAETRRRFRNTKPIITPRFIPSCSDALMAGLSDIQKETLAPVQSHLSENRGEIKWVKELCPDSAFYGDAYDRFGLFGRDCKTVMAHCVSSTEEELERMRKNGVFIAHCPSSNMNLSSGIAPMRKILDKGIPAGIGTDVAGGHSLSMADEAVRAVQASKMRWRYVEDEKPLTIIDAFYLATRGGGAFFGKVGSFEKGFEFDAVVVDDSKLGAEYDGASKLTQALYLNTECKIVGKYARGVKINLD